MTVHAPLQPAPGTMDVDEFMAFLETRPHGERWDLIEGAAVMMAPASYAHQRITYNLCALLNGAFAAQRRDLFAYFDAGVRSPGVRNFQPQPDVGFFGGAAQICFSHRIVSSSRSSRRVCAYVPRVMRT